MSLSMSDYLETQVAAHIFRTASFTKPTVLSLAILKTLPTDDAGASLAELTKTGYARIQRDPLDANWSTVVDNVASFAYGALTGALERAIGAALYDAHPTGGNLLFWSALATPWAYAAVDVSADLFQATAHGQSNTDRVFLRDINNATGILQPVEYFIVGATTDTFQVSLTSGGAAVTITGADGWAQYGIAKARDVDDGDTLTINAGDIDFLFD